MRVLALVLHNTICAYGQPKERKEPEQRHVFDDFEMELEIERENDFSNQNLKIP